MRKSRVQLLALLGVVLVGLLRPAWADEVVAVITEISAPNTVSILSDPPRKAALFAVIQSGEAVRVEGDGSVTLQIAGRQQVVTRDNSPYRLESVESGDSVASNVLDWALSVLGADAGSEDSPRAVAMASRGKTGLALPFVGPFQNHLQARDELVIPVAAQQPDYVSFQSGDFLLEPAVQPLRVGLIGVDTRTLPPGDYRMSVCAGAQCRHASVRWQSELGPVLPDRYRQTSHELLGSLALIEEGDAVQLEGFQRLWSCRDRYELANRLLLKWLEGEEQGK